MKVGNETNLGMDYIEDFDERTEDLKRTTTQLNGNQSTI